MDKRSEPRMDRDVGIFVHVHTCDEHPELIGKSIPCDAMDFSPHGIRFKSNLLLPPGSLINVTLGVGKPLSVFLLLGEVRWEFEKDGQLMMGSISSTENKAIWNVGLIHSIFPRQRIWAWNSPQFYCLNSTALPPVTIFPSESSPPPQVIPDAEISVSSVLDRLNTSSTFHAAQSSSILSVSHWRLSVLP